MMYCHKKLLYLVRTCQSIYNLSSTTHVYIRTLFTCRNTDLIFIKLYIFIKSIEIHRFIKPIYDISSTTHVFIKSIEIEV